MAHETSRKDEIRGRYYYKDVILRLKCLRYTNDKIADILDISVSTVKKIAQNGFNKEHNCVISELIGEDESEFLREAAVNSCRELFAKKGWQTATSESKCLFDIFCVKGNRTVKVQVRSSSKFSPSGFPMFKTCRILFNTKRAKRVQFTPGDFDYWYFYSINGDIWLVPFDRITQRSVVTMKGYDEYFV